MNNLLNWKLIWIGSLDNTRHSMIWRALRWVENFKPEMKKSDRVFQVIHHNGATPSLKHMYDDYREYFANLLDRIGHDRREAGDIYSYFKLWQCGW